MLYFGRGFLPIQYATLLPRTFRLVNAVGYGVGSMFMMAGGVLVILKMAKREDDPEVALHQKVPWLRLCPWVQTRSSLCRNPGRWLTAEA